MTLTEAIEKAKAAGLKLLPCHVCDGASARPCADCGAPEEFPRICVDCCMDRPWCHECAHSGEDRTPGGVVLAIWMWCSEHGRAWLSLLGEMACITIGLRLVREPHDGTPEGLAVAALLAWLEARNEAK